MIYLNGQEITPTIFPDKTSQVWKIEEGHLGRPFADIVWKFESEAEIMHLAQLRVLLDVYDIASYLYIPFLPYARQDKIASNTTTFALIPFVILLNSMHFKTITIMDPHNLEVLENLENSRFMFPKDQVAKAIKETNSDLLCYPDKGALEKYKKMYVYPFVHGEKERDPLNGHITAYSINVVCEGRNVLIVDDICDGGATFILLAQELKNKNAKEINLFVSHGIFSRGIKVLKDAGINRIFTQYGEVLNDPSNSIS